MRLGQIRVERQRPFRGRKGPGECQPRPLDRIDADEGVGVCQPREGQRVSSIFLNRLLEVLQRSHEPAVPTARPVKRPLR